MKSPLDIIKQELLGDFHHRFSLGDTVELHFSQCILTAQAFIFDGHDLVTQRIIDAFPVAKSAIDLGDVGGAMVLGVSQRSEVTQCILHDNGSLIVIFASGVRLVFPTDTELVDWHWALTRRSADPYTDFIVGAFEDGQLKTNQCEQGGDGDAEEAV